MVSYYISSSNQNKLHSRLSSHPAFALDSLQSSSAATNITSQQRTKERERVRYLENTDADKYHVLKPVMHRIKKIKNKENNDHKHILQISKINNMEGFL